MLKRVYMVIRLDKVYCGYSLEASHWGASNEYPKHTFSWRNKKLSLLFGWKMPYLELSEGAICEQRKPRTSLHIRRKWSGPLLFTQLNCNFMKSRSPTVKALIGLHRFGGSFSPHLFIQSNLNDSNMDGSFTVDDSNSFFSPYKILPIAQENKYLGIFSYFIMALYVVCTH